MTSFASTSLPLALRAVRDAVELDKNGKAKEAYCHYLSSMLFIIQSLKDDGWENDLSQVCNKDTFKLFKLIQQCHERAFDILSSFRTDGYHRNQNNEIGSASCPPGFLFSSSNHKRDTSPGYRKQFSESHPPVSSSGSQISMDESDIEKLIMSLPEPPKAKGSQDISSSKSSRTPPPLVSRTHLQSQQMFQAYQKRKSMTSSLSQKYASAEYNLGLLRKMAENLAIRKAKQDALSRKLKERQERLRQKAEQRVADKSSSQSSDKEYQKRIYAKVLEFEQETSWPQKLRDDLKEDCENTRLIEIIVSKVLRSKEHPIGQIVAEMQYMLYKKISILVQGFIAPMYSKPPYQKGKDNSDLDIEAEIQSANQDKSSEERHICDDDGLSLNYSHNVDISDLSNSLIGPYQDTTLAEPLEDRPHSPGKSGEHMEPVDQLEDQEQMHDSHCATSDQNLKTDEQLPEEIQVDITKDNLNIPSLPKPSNDDQDTQNQGKAKAEGDESDDMSNMELAKIPDSESTELKESNEKRSEQDSKISESPDHSEEPEQSRNESDDHPQISNDKEIYQIPSPEQANDKSLSFDFNTQDPFTVVNDLPSENDELLDELGNESTEPKKSLIGPTSEYPKQEQSTNRSGDNESVSTNISETKEESTHSYENDKEPTVSTTGKSTIEPMNSSDISQKVAKNVSREYSVEDIRISMSAFQDAYQDLEDFLLEDPDSDLSLPDESTSEKIKPSDVGNCGNKAVEVKHTESGAIHSSEVDTNKPETSKQHKEDSSHVDNLFDSGKPDIEHSDNQEPNKKDNTENNSTLLCKQEEIDTAEKQTDISEAKERDAIFEEDIQTNNEKNISPPQERSPTAASRPEESKGGLSNSATVSEKGIEGSNTEQYPDKDSVINSSVTIERPDSSQSKIGPDYENKLNAVIKEIHFALDRLHALLLLTYDELERPVGRDQSYASLEAVFFEPIWPWLNLALRRFNQDKEMILFNVVKEKWDLPPYEFSVREQFTLSDVEKTSEVNAPYQLAITELQKITSYVSPLDKLECAVRTSRSICQCVQEYWENKDGSKVPTVGCDDLLPILSYVIVKAALPELVSECNVMEEFIHEGYLMGEEGYCLTTLQTAVTYLLTLCRTS